MGLKKYNEAYQRLEKTVEQMNKEIEDLKKLKYQISGAVIVITAIAQAVYTFLFK